MFVLAGNVACASKLGPIAAKSRSATLIPPSSHSPTRPNVTQCGLPMLTAVHGQVSPPTSTGAATAAPSLVAGSVVGTSGGLRTGLPMSTATWPSARTSGWMSPARVPTL